MNATVKDVMTTAVVVVRRGATFKEMASALRRYRVSALPVVDADGKVIGVVSEADMLAKEVHRGVIDGLMHYKEAHKAGGLTAGDLMTHPAVTVRPGDSVEHAARLMYNLRIKRLPVVDAGGGLVGVISRTDLLAVYDRPDSEIRDEIEGLIRHEFLLSQFAVSVQDGVVTLAGSPETAALRRYRVSALPVIDDQEKVIGVVSEADMLAKEVHRGLIDELVHHKEVHKADGLTAGDLMTHPAVTVRPGDSVEHAARLMYNLRIKRLPVVDAGGGLVGVISRTDLLAVYDRPDEQIREEIEGLIRPEFGPSQFTVTVHDGVVILQGSPETAALGHHLVGKVRHVQGVVAVRDRFSYPDAYPIVAGPVL